MLKLNIKAFVNGLADLPECDKDEPLLGEGYLTERIALPFLMGAYLSLQDIDFDAFDPEDARAMYYRCEQADSLGGSVLQLYQPAVYTKPVPQPQICYV